MQTGDIGRPIRVTVTENGTAKDVSTATTKQLVFRKPDDGTVKTFAAAFYSDGTDGIVQYTTAAATDINAPGTWEVQASFVIGAATFRTTIGTFEVGKNLGASQY